MGLLGSSHANGLWAGGAQRTAAEADVLQAGLLMHPMLTGQNALEEPAHTFYYVDRARRLQITWHAVKKEIDLATGMDVIGKMAASFRITRDPTAQFEIATRFAAFLDERPCRRDDVVDERSELAVDAAGREAGRDSKPSPLPGTVSC